jgi:hypothetical protein
VLVSDEVFVLAGHAAIWERDRNASLVKMCPDARVDGPDAVYVCARSL